MLISIAVILFCISRTEQGGGESNWGYKSGKSFVSPDNWQNVAEWTCGGRRQSPIDIVKKNTQFRSELKTVNLTRSQSSKNATFSKSATSLYLSFSDYWNITFNGVGCLRPNSIHWHWGSTDKGSEHTVDGNRYSMESHIVTYNCLLYKSYDAAQANPSGLHVFGVLYKEDATNSVIDKLMPFFDTVIKNGSATIPEISPAEFFPVNLASYYRYEGSLTTPPCTENVIWTVFSEIQTLSSVQLAKFRSLNYSAPEEGAMGDNFRPAFQVDSSADYMPRVVYSSMIEPAPSYFLSLDIATLFVGLFLRH